MRQTKESRRQVQCADRRGNERKRGKGALARERKRERWKMGKDGAPADERDFHANLCRGSLTPRVGHFDWWLYNAAERRSSIICISRIEISYTPTISTLISLKNSWAIIRNARLCKTLVDLTDPVHTAFSQIFFLFQDRLILRLVVDKTGMTDPFINAADISISKGR